MKINLLQRFYHPFCPPCPILAFRDPLGINKTAPLPEGSCHAVAEGRECCLRLIAARIGDV